MKNYSTKIIVDEENQIRETPQTQLHKGISLIDIQYTFLIMI